MACKQTSRNACGVSDPDGRRRRIKSAAFTLVAALAILLHGAVVAANAEPTEPTLSGLNQPPGAKDNFDPVYNVCRGTDAEVLPHVGDGPARTRS